MDQDTHLPWGQLWAPRTLTPGTGRMFAEENQAVSSLLLGSQVGEANKN